VDTRLNRLFLRNRVARRILLLIVCCALLPILAFAWYAYRQIGLQASHDNQDRLSHLAKIMGMSIYERLVLLDVELSHVASGVLSGIPFRDYSDDGRGSSESGFVSIALVSQDGTSIPLMGAPGTLPELPSHTDDPKSILLCVRDFKSATSVFPKLYLCRMLYQGAGFARWVIGEVKLENLWGIGDLDNWPAMTDFCILDSSDNVLVSSFSEDQIARLVHEKNQSSGSRSFEWHHASVGYQAAHWNIFLRSRFQAEAWNIIMSQSEERLFQQLTQFKSVFSLMTLLSLALVMYFSIRYIQKSFIALEYLREGTIRIAAGDFTSTLVVESGDEFEELAHSFNTMSNQVEHQIKLLTSRSRLDRSLLNSFEPPRIVRNLQETFAQHFEGISARVILIGSETMGKLRRFQIGGSIPEDRLIQMVNEHHQDLTAYFRNHEYWIAGKGPNLPEGIASCLRTAGQQLLIVPVFSNLSLSAIVIAQYPETIELTSEECRFARQLADQAGIALANANTLSKLDRHNWETMQALARAVDANSPWTAGHSERVTRLAMTIADQLPLNRQEMENLHRAALLHDVGKLGIPSSILNNPAKLTDEEFELIKSHPGKGATILEPINSYAALIPIVSQHHERFDGTGYPFGLKGEAISQGARIIAVADAFDAMVSDRPYRAGLSEKRAIELIREGAGTQFDPQLVEIFLKIAETRSITSIRNDI
jgi:putative nucleotidyltransferase with HDIG domain